MSGFAALWCVWGLSTLPGVPLALLLVPVALAGTLIAFATRLPGHASETERRRVGRIIAWASLGEFIAIALANTLLYATGHGEYAACAIAGIVGLHFLPLAHFLKIRGYFVTGAMLAALAAASCVIADAQSRDLTVRLGAATLLWLTCLSKLAHKPATERIAA